MIDKCEVESRRQKAYMAQFVLLDRTFIFRDVLRKFAREIRCTGQFRAPEMEQGGGNLGKIGTDKQDTEKATLIEIEGEKVPYSKGEK
jgi:hypothetical protein